MDLQPQFSGRSSVDWFVRVLNLPVFTDLLHIKFVFLLTLLSEDSVFLDLYMNNPAGTRGILQFTYLLWYKPRCSHPIWRASRWECQGDVFFSGSPSSCASLARTRSLIGWFTEFVCFFGTHTILDRVRCWGLKYQRARSAHHLARGICFRRVKASTWGCHAWWCYCACACSWQWCQLDSSWSANSSRSHSDLPSSGINTRFLSTWCKSLVGFLSFLYYCHRGAVFCSPDLAWWSALSASARQTALRGLRPAFLHPGCSVLPSQDFLKVMARQPGHIFSPSPWLIPKPLVRHSMLLWRRGPRIFKSRDWHLPRGMAYICINICIYIERERVVSRLLGSAGSTAQSSKNVQAQNFIW